MCLLGLVFLLLLWGFVYECLCDTGDAVCALGKCSTTEPLLQLIPFFQGISGPLNEEVEAQKGQRESCQRWLLQMARHGW